jgi:hypothetical protein
VRAAMIPEQFLIYSSILSSLAGLVPYLKGNIHPAGLCKFHDDHEHFWNHSNGIDDEMAGVSMAEDLFNWIELDLAVVADEDWEDSTNADLTELASESAEIAGNPEPASVPAETVGDSESTSGETTIENLGPSCVETILGVWWDPGNGILWYKGKIARKPKGNPGYIKILEEFQRQNWPRHLLNNPLAGPHDSASDLTLRGDTLRTLNDGLEFLKFCGDGSGKGIRCEIVHPAISHEQHPDQDHEQHPDQDPEQLP